MTLANRYVLVVEDDPDYLEMLSDILRENGAEVATARNGKEALEAIEDRPPDIVFTDLVMPKIQGEQLIRYIRETPEIARVPIVVVSGAIREYSGFEHLGADHYVEKSDHDTLRKNILKICRSLTSEDEEGRRTIPLDSVPGYRKVVAELLENRRKDEQIINHVKVGLVRFDHDLKILSANPAAEQLVGRPRPKLLGTYVHALFGRRHTRELKKVLQTAAADPAVNTDLMISTADKSLELHVSTTGRRRSQTDEEGLLLIYDLSREVAAQKNLKQRIKELDLLNHIARQFNSSLSEEAVFNTLLERSVKLLDAEAGTIALLEEPTAEGQNLVFAYTHGTAADCTQQIRIKKNIGCIGWVVGHNRPLRINDVDNDKRFFNKIDHITGFKTRSVVCVPINSEGRLIGVIEIINKKKGRFRDDDLRLLNTLVDMAALNIRNSLLHEDIVKQRNYYSNIMQSLREGLVVVDDNHTILDLNSYFERFLNNARSQLIGRKCYQVFNRTEQPCADCVLDTASDNPCDEQGRFKRTYQNADRQWHHFLASVNPLDIEDTDRRSHLITFTDITRTERLHHYLRASADVASLLLREENVTRVAEEVLEMMGRAANADRAYWIDNRLGSDGRPAMFRRAEWCARGIAPHQKMADRSGTPYDRPFQRWYTELSAGRIITGAVTEFSTEEQCALQAEGIVSILMIPLIIGDRFEGFLGFDNCVDNTVWQDAEINLLRSAADSLARAVDFEKSQYEKKSLQERLQHAQIMESVGELSSGISHNFRNILAGIIVNAQLIQSRFRKNRKLTRTVERIIHLAETGSELVGGLLQYSRRGLKGKRKVFNLAELLEETYQLITTTFDQKITVHRKWPEQVAIEGNYSELSQVFMNFFTNARDAMPDGGELTISVRTEGDTVAVRIADSGCGMDDKTVKKIFDPFFTTKEPGKGTGLGLSTAYGIVLDHGGNIEVDSETNRGTIFTIALPLREHQPQIGPVATEPVTRGTQQKILIADDQKALALSLTEFLRSIDYQVEAVSDGAAAVQKYADWQPDLVIMDRNMPVVDGISAARSILARDPAARIVFMSGYDQIGPEGLSELLNSAIKAYVTKPFKLSDFSRTIAAAMTE